MYVHLSQSDFEHRMEMLAGGNFSRPALRRLYAYYSAFESATGTPVEFDPEMFRMDWAEYRRPSDVVRTLFGETIPDQQEAQYRLVESGVDFLEVDGGRVLAPRFL